MPWRRRQESPGPHPPPDAARTSDTGSSRLFLDAEEAQRRVDLRGDLEADAAHTDLTAELHDAVRRLGEAIASEAEQRLLAELDSGLGAGLELPPVPQVILRVQRLIDSDDFHVGDVAREVELDLALSKKVVGIANSPFYAGMEPATSAQDAIVRIGIIETRNILMAILMRSRLFRVPGSERLARELWEHALAASVTSRCVAAELGLEPDHAFLAGLVHDIGKGVILSLAAKLRVHSRGRLESDPEALERVLQALHPLVGALVIESWHLGETLATAVRHHHAPAAAPQTARRLAAVIEAANTIARRLGSGAGSDEEGARADDVELAAARLGPLGLAPEQAEEVVCEAREAFADLTKLL